MLMECLLHIRHCSKHLEYRVNKIKLWPSWSLYSNDARRDNTHHWVKFLVLLGSNIH